MQGYLGNLFGGCRLLRLGLLTGASGLQVQGFRLILLVLKGEAESASLGPRIDPISSLTVNNPSFLPTLFRTQDLDGKT